MIYKKKIIETIINWLNLSPQATYVMNFIEFNNVFFSKLFFYCIRNLFLNQFNIER